MKLPAAFTDRMKNLLGEEFALFEESYAQPRRYGLRVNTLKITPEVFERTTPFHLKPIGWMPGAFEYEEQDAASRHPFYHAGLYYLQEPSAMTPASVLAAVPGDRVLDMCAAPGGKSTALAAQLKGRGVLVANDISASRCRALIRNLEGFGVVNAVVTNAVPARLTERFGAFFDKVLVDAPCSGEGMFRKDDGAVRAWYPEKNEECARIQRDLVLQAADMLRPGGRMVYSTCTFAPEENEEILAYLLEKRPQMHLLPVPRREGFAPAFSGEVLRAVPEYARRRESGLAPSRELTEEEAACCVRLWPHRTGGEGHFLALFEKDDSAVVFNDSGSFREAEGMVKDSRGALLAVSDADLRVEKRGGKRGRGRDDAGRGAFGGRGRDVRGGGASGGRGRDERGGRGTEEVSLRDQMRILSEFGEQTGAGYILQGNEQRITIRGGQANLTVEGLPDLAGIPVLHNGLYLGEVRKDRFEPSQSLAMALTSDGVKAVIDLPADDERVQRYLRGETLNLSDDEVRVPGGWQLVCAGGYPLGWGRLSGTLLKNKYHPGWRQKV